DARVPAGGIEHAQDRRVLARSRVALQRRPAAERVVPERLEADVDDVGQLPLAGSDDAVTPAHRAALDPGPGQVERDPRARRRHVQLAMPGLDRSYPPPPRPRADL